jgi:hypothetical protein
MSYGTPPPPPGYGAPTYGAVPPQHRQAVTVLVLGILGLALCQVLGIPAWIMGNRVVREIDASGGAVGGRGLAQAGRICGIIATVFLALALLLVLGIAVFGTVVTSSFSDTQSSVG